jgi:hypothetical protein
MTAPSPQGTLTRRSLLLAGASAAATVAIPSVAIAAGRKVARRSHLNRSTWAPLVGTIVETRNPGQPRVPLLLLRIDDLTSGYTQPEKFREKTFVLVFRGPAGQPLADGTHRIFVPGVGKVDIWFSGSSLTADGWQYVAVFSNARLRQRPLRKPRGHLSKEQRRAVKRGEHAAHKLRKKQRRRRG